MNFKYLRELTNSWAFKKSCLHYQLVSCLEPLNATQVCKYSRFVLDERGFDHGLVEDFVEAVSEFPQCHGRARFIAFLLDSFIQDPEHDINDAKHEFIQRITDAFPLRFYLEDQQMGLNKIAGSDTLYRMCCEGLTEFMIKGVAHLHIKNDDVSVAIEAGLGFREISYGGAFSTIVLKELAVIDCLRTLIPFRDVIGRLAQSLTLLPKPHMVGYVLEYLVAFGLVAKLNPNKLHELKPSKFSFPQYIEFAEPNEIYFPDHCCGPDIVYKHNHSLYLVQVNFVKMISRQERMQACNTMDPNYFYWNYKKETVLKGFEEDRNSILHLLDGINCTPMVFLHTEMKIMADMKNMIVINEETCPAFFDAVDKGIWPLLNAMRKKFDEE